MVETVEAVEATLTGDAAMESFSGAIKETICTSFGSRLFKNELLSLEILGTSVNRLSISPKPEGFIP